MKKAPAAPSTLARTIRIHSCPWPLSRTAARVSSATARMASDESITSWRGRRSAHTPPTGRNTTRAVVDAARTSPRALAVCPTCRAANANATGTSASPVADTACPIQSRRKFRSRSGARAPDANINPIILDAGGIASARWLRSWSNGAELDPVLLARGEKRKQSQALLGDGRTVLAPDRLFERREEQGGGALGFGRDPARPDAPVDANRAFHDPVAAEESEVLPGGHDPRPIGVGEKDVVVVGEESHGSRRLGCWAWGARPIEQLDPALVVERGQSGPELFERRAHRQAGPGAHVGGRGWAEGREVAEDELVLRDRGAGRPAEPRLHPRQGDRAAGLPDLPRRG